eukprot:gene6148-6615_t
MTTFFSINAFQLLRLGRFPTFQEARQGELLTEFNPFKVNFYISHPTLSANLDSVSIDQHKKFYFHEFTVVLFRMINRCLYLKFLDDDRNDLYQFDKEFIYDRATAFDLYRQILDPTEDELNQVIGRYLNLDLLTKDIALMILAYLNDFYIWIDWSCLPDVNQLSSAQIEHVYDENQEKRDWIIENSFVLCLWECAEQFRDAWCLIESLLSLRVGHCFFHNTSNDYELINHQFNTKNVRNSASSTSSTPKLQKRKTFIPSVSVREPDELTDKEKEKDISFFTDYSKLPKFFIRLLKHIQSAGDIQIIFQQEKLGQSILLPSINTPEEVPSSSAAVSSSSAPLTSSGRDEITSRIMKLIITNYEKYSYQFYTYTPLFQTRIPKDYRSKLINRLQNIYIGGRYLFNPLLIEYITPPISRMSLQKYRLLVEDHLSNITPFYSDSMIAYYPGEVTTLDPYILLHATFDLHELKGYITNIDLEIVEVKNPPEHPNLKAPPISSSSLNSNRKISKDKGKALDQEQRKKSTEEEQLQEEDMDDHERPLLLTRHIEMDELIERMKSYQMTSLSSLEMYRYYPKIHFHFPCTLSLCNDSFFQYLVSYKYVKEYSKPNVILYENKLYKRARQKHFITQWNLHLQWWRERTFRLTVNDLVYIDEVDSSNSQQRVKGDIAITDSTYVREVALTDHHPLYRETRDLHNKMISHSSSSDPFPGHLLEIYNKRKKLTKKEKKVEGSNDDEEVLLTVYLTKKETSDLFQFYFNYRHTINEALWLNISKHALESEYYCQDNFQVYHLYRHFHGHIYQEKFQQISRTILEKTGGNVHHLFETGK